MTKCTAKVIIWHTQEALITERRVRKSISSTESFRESYNSFSTSMSASGLLSGMFHKVARETTWYKEYREKFAYDEVAYHKDFLQLILHERKEVTIDGHCGCVEEAKYLQSVPTDRPKTLEELQQLSENYIKIMYRNIEEAGLIIGPKCTYEEHWTIDRPEPCAYKFRTALDQWIARPIVAKGWPCGSTGSSQRHWLVRARDGRRTCLEELEHGDLVRIQTESTPDRGFDMMYASDKRWIYYDRNSGNPKQIWRVHKNSNTNVAFENAYQRRYYLGTYGGWLAVSGGRTAWEATPCR